MPTIIESLKADEWSKLGNYKNGCADQIGATLERFYKDLPKEVKEWLQHTQSIRREEAIVCFQNALDIYNKKGEAE